MSNEIEINGETFIKRSAIKALAATKKQIVVLEQGWIVVGDVLKNGDYIHVVDASVIRRWGTKNGLGELAEKGPLPETVLDRCPECQVHKLKVVMIMNCNEERWQ